MAITYTERVGSVLLHKHDNDYIRRVNYRLYGEEDSKIEYVEERVFLDAKPSSGFVEYSTLNAVDQEATVLSWAKTKMGDTLLAKLKERLNRKFGDYNAEEEIPSNWTALPDES